MTPDTLHPLAKDYLRRSAHGITLGHPGSTG